jgi:hypothetical protein
MLKQLYIYVHKDTSHAIYLEDQIRIFGKKEKRNLSEVQEIVNILLILPDSYYPDQSDKILLILKVRQESFFFPLERTLV